MAGSSRRAGFGRLPKISFGMSFNTAAVFSPKCQRSPPLGLYLRRFFFPLIPHIPAFVFTPNNQEGSLSATCTATFLGAEKCHYITVCWTHWFPSSKLTVNGKANAASSSRRTLPLSEFAVCNELLSCFQWLFLKATVEKISDGAFGRLVLLVTPDVLSSEVS